MYKLLSLFVLLSVGLISFAQSSKDEDKGAGLTYTLLKDDPQDIPHLSIGVSPLTMGIGSSSLGSYEVGLLLHAQLNENFSLRSNIL